MFQKSQAEGEEPERYDAHVQALQVRESWSRPRIGRFELIARLGRGATGVVYEARDTRDGSLVALKLLSHVDARAITRFKREFRALCELAHENLVQLHELFAEGERWYFTMELVHGVQFTRYVRMNDSDSGDHHLTKLEQVSRQLFGAVSFLHAAGHVHCDLKPSNVLVTKTGRVVVLDFSLVTDVDDPMTKAFDATPSVHGTPEFMAPEIVAGGPPTPQSDAYALGVMLFQALNGVLPAAAPSRIPARVTDRSSQLLRDLRDICAALMEVDPSRRLRVGAAAARLGDPDPGALRLGSPPAPPFVGRARELSLLDAAFAESRRNGPVAVFVSGTSGIGKSVLCDAFAAKLRGHAVVLRGRCHEREAMPHKAFDGVIDALARHLTDLPPDQQRALAPPHLEALLRMFPSLHGVRGWTCDSEASMAREQTQLRQRAFIALKALLRGCAQRVPLVLIVDDLQWADVDSAQLLLELLGPPDAAPLLYVGCHRPRHAQPSDFLEALFEDAAARWQCECHAIELGTLSEAEADALTARLLGAERNARESTHARIVHEAEGHPFLISELAGHFNREADEGALPSLASLFARRTAGLEPAAHRTLMLLAFAARPVQTSVLANALGSRRDAANALQQLLRRGLIRRGRSAEWVIYHDAFREHACQLADEHHAGSLHGTLAHAYESAGCAEPEWLIEHWRAAGDRLRALEYSVSAARAAAHNLAFNRAAALYQAALRLLSAGDERRSQLQAELGEAFANAGRSAQAAEAFVAAVVGAPPASALSLRCRAAAHMFRSGHTEAGNALLEQLMRDVGVSYPQSQLGLYRKLLASRARLQLHKLAPRRHPTSPPGKVAVLEAVFREILFLEPLRGALLLSLFHEEALKSGRPDQLFVALAWETYGLTAQGGLKAQRQTARNIERLSQLSEELGTAYAAGTVLMVQTAAALYEYRLFEVDGFATAAQHIFATQCSGAFWEESICDALHGSALEGTGPLSLICQSAPKLVRRARERSDDFADAMLCRTRSVAHLVQDQPELAISFLHQRLASLDDAVDRALDLRRWLIIQSLADSQSYAAQAREAWVTFERIWPAYLRSPFERTDFIRTASHYRRGRLAVALRSQGGGSDLVRTAEHHARVLSRLRTAAAVGSACVIRAGLAAQHGELAEARRLLAHGETACRSIGMVIPANAIRRQLGVISEGAVGRKLIEEADAALRQLGVMNPARWADAFICPLSDRVS